MTHRHRARKVFLQGGLGHPSVEALPWNFGPEEPDRHSSMEKKQLGNSDHWRRIFLLNSWLNPDQVVPEGTMIFLPRQ